MAVHRCKRATLARRASSSPLSCGWGSVARGHRPRKTVRGSPGPAAVEGYATRHVAADEPGDLGLGTVAYTRMFTTVPMPAQFQSQSESSRFSPRHP